MTDDFHVQPDPDCAACQAIGRVSAEVPAPKEPEEDAFEAGYAEAIARLRDDERYRSWWSANGTFPTGEIRRHLADYLETIGAAE